MADIVTILGLGTVLSVGGILPRVGLVGALRLGFRNHLWWTNGRSPSSVRKSEMQQLNDKLQRMKNPPNTMEGNRRERCIVVTGEGGYGKSCMIHTALKTQPGVMQIRAESGASQSSIVNAVLYELSGIECTSTNPEGSARRVMFFHSLLFKRPPIVVIGVSERRRDDRYADLAPAVAELTEEYGLRVIVDGTPNAIPPNLDGMVMVVEPMSREQLEPIPELNGLMALLQCHRLDDAVWQVLGGSPLCYEALKMDLFLSKATSDDDVVTEVKHHIRSTLARALSQTHFRSPHTEQALQFFREKKLPKMTNAAFVEMGFTLVPSDRVFREVMIENDDMYIVPYSPAMSLVITHGIRDGPGLSALSDQLFHAAGEDTSTL